MERGGDLDDCVSTPEADDLCSKMEEIKKSKLPIPGEVDFVNGGPPCQVRMDKGVHDGYQRQM